MKQLKIIISSILVLTVMVFVVNFSSAYFFKKSLFNAYIVTSGSMEPVIMTGSLVLSAPSAIYLPNDVITYKDGKKLVTHRIEARLYPNGNLNEPEYLTSGDANKSFDRIKLTESQIVGKVLYSIPYLGYIADFAKTPKGFILFVIIPATIIGYEELKYLLDSAKKKLKEKGKMKKEILPRIKSIVPKSKAFAAVPIVGAAVVFVGLTGSYFSDNEKSSDNVFQAGVWTTPTPTPLPQAQTLVINEVMPNSNCSLGGGKSAAWIEIWNGFDVPVDLKNFKLNDGTNTVDIVNAVTILQPNSYALLAKDGSVWTQCFTPPPGATTVNLGSNSPININSGVLRLVDTDGVTILDRVEFSPSIQPDTSYERVALGQDTALGDTFTASDFGNQCPSTPGTWSALNGVCPIVINEIMWMGSSLSTADEWIELKNMTLNPVDLSGWSIEGSGITISSGTIPANGYFLVSNYSESNVSSVINITPDITDTGIGLVNNNFKITLKNNFGSIVDTAGNGSDPLTGDNAPGSNPDSSMERSIVPGNGALVGNWGTTTIQTNIDAGRGDKATPKAANGI